MNLTKRFRAVGVACLLFLGAVHAADTRPPVLERMLRVEYWGVGLNEAARDIQTQTGVEVLFYRPDLPADRNTDDLYMVSGRVRLEAVLQALARRYHFRFRVAGTGRVELSKGYGWVEPKPVLRFQRLDRLSPPGAAAGEDMRRLLAEFVKPLPLLSGDFSLLIENNPAPGNPNSLRSVEVLPPVLADYLEKAVKCLEGEAGDFPPSPARPRNHLFAAARRTSGDFQVLLAREVAVPPAGGLRRALRDMADEAGVVVVLDAAPAEADAVALNLSSSRVGLGRLTEELARRHELGRRVFLPSGAVFFEKGAGDDLAMDSRSRESFWDGLAVAGFDARAAAEAAGGGQALTAAVRRDVYPGLWRDPVCALVYCAATGRLAVIAPANVMEAIAEKLASLGRRE